MPDNCPDSSRECPSASRVEALEDANKNHSRTHEGMYDRIRALETENAVQNAHWKNVDGKLDELTVMVRDLTGRAGKRWESLADKALWAVCAAVIAFLLGRVGL